MEQFKKSLLKLLSENAKYTDSDLSSMLGEPIEKIVAAREELENSGAIVKYAAIVNTEVTEPNRVQAFIEVRVAPQKLKGFDSYAEEIYEFKEVTSLYLMSGGFDLAVFVEGENLAAIAKFVAEKLSVIEGIVGVATHFILKKYKIEGQITCKGEERERQIIQA